MRIAIFGAGGIGCWLGGRLQEAGADVVFIARGEHGKALHERGLRLIVAAAEGPSTVIVEPLRVYPDTSSAAAAGVSVDCCILCVKTFQVRDAARDCAAILSPQGFVVTTQNGVDAPYEAIVSLPSKQVVGGSCKVFSFVESPGVVRVGGTGSFTFGEVFDNSGLEVADARSPRIENLHNVMSKAKGVNSAVGHGEPRPSMWMALWEKAVGMCSSGPVGALTRASMDAVASCPESKALLRAAMLEVVHVAEKSGFKLTEDPDAYVEGRLDFVSRMKGATTSTTRDVITGKPSEVRELSGAIVRAAARAGTQAPTHQFILAALLPQERRSRGEFDYELNGIPGGAPHVQSRL